MKSIIELTNKFTKKSVGNKTRIEDVPQDETPSLWSRMLDNSERPYITFDITSDEIFNDLNEGRE